MTHNHHDHHDHLHVDHHLDSYTDQQRADLERVLAFNARFAASIDAVRDTRETEMFLDPDPLRYMWVDEGQGLIADIIERADKLLDVAPPLVGHRRVPVTRLTRSTRASRPAIAVGPGGATACCWTEWVPDRGDLVRVAVAPPGGDLADATPVTLDAEVTDIYRPTVVWAGDGSAWAFFGRASTSGVGVWGVRRAPGADGGWGRPEPVSTGEHPAFNQEAVAHPDGSVEVCWQGRVADRFAIHARTWHPRSGWGDPWLVSDGVEDNVWDPAIAGFPDGSAAYAWAQFHQGSYRVVVRTRDADGRLGEPRALESGRGYALHPSLAVTTDEALWCAFDLIDVAEHGGSGPTRLRPAAEVGADPSVVAGARTAGNSVPSDLLPEISGRVQVVRVDADGVSLPEDVHGRPLGEALDVVPAGLPKLAALPDGGLAVSYRVHRRLPLMTFYWEVAAQFLGSQGWLPPVTLAGSDGTLEEVAVASSGRELMIAAQCDDRLARSLQWTEGFGGRECVYLTDHQGEVIWHSLTDVGSVVLGRVTAPVECAPPARLESMSVESTDLPGAARRWAGAEATERYRTTAGGRDYALYWGDLHRHSLVSRCTSGDEPNLEDFYRYAWDVCEYDFWAVTDHSENSSAYQWWSIQKIADLFHIPGRFVPFYGFEWTSPDTGHQNVIYGDVARGAPTFSAFAEGTTTPQGLWDALDAHPDYPAITIPHHPGSAMVHNDWDYHHPVHSRLVEVFQACRGNYEAPGAFRQYSDATATGTFVIDGLKRGHRFGLIGSSDHGFGASYVGAYAESLDRASVFEALTSRRTFAATTRDILLDFRLGPAFMGEEVELDGARVLTVHAQGYADLARVDVIRNGDLVHSHVPDLGLPDGWIAVPLRLEWGGAHELTDWDGELSVEGGRVQHTPYYSPEIVAVDDSRIAWRNSTRSFGEPYGAQRGGLECTVLGPAAATVEIRSGDRHARLGLAELDRQAEAVPLPGGRGHFFVQPGVGGLTSLGTRALDLTWTDHHRTDDGTDFYYVRAFQVDGEMAWSSPIWVSPTGRA